MRHAVAGDVVLQLLSNASCATHHETCGEMSQAYTSHPPHKKKQRPCAWTRVAAVPEHAPQKASMHTRTLKAQRIASIAAFETLAISREETNIQSAPSIPNCV